MNKQRTKFGKIKYTIFVTLLLLVSFILLGFISPLVLSEYDIHDDKIPEEFNGFKIIQISDFHCKEFGEEESKLIQIIQDTSPDIICLTGDIIDESHSTKNACLLIDKLTEIAPIYYVSGNHEYYDGTPFEEFKEFCISKNVYVLDSDTVDINRNTSTIKISGLDWKNINNNLVSKLGFADTSFYNILLYHDSSKFDFTSSFDYNLLLCGHIHGGLIRLPLIGGLFGTDGFFFPKYDHGLYTKYNSKMIVSSGLGDARIPRWNNPREVVLITLYNE